MTRGAHTGGRPRRVGFELTPRQREVMRLRAKGLTRKEIALELGVAESTVKSHVDAAFANLGRLMEDER